MSQRVVNDLYLRHIKIASLFSTQHIYIKNSCCMIKRYKLPQTFVPKDPLSIFSNPKARTQSDIPVHNNNIQKMCDKEKKIIIIYNWDLLTVKLTKPWTPEISMECYYVVINKPIRCKITKPQRATVILQLWFWDLLAYPELLYCDYCDRFSEFDSNTVVY